MKKLTSMLLLCVLVLTMCAGCGKEEKPTLKVGMEIGYPPFEYYDLDGETPIGVDVELAYALGEELGMEVELVDTAWAGIFEGVNKGDYDCVISAVTINAERLLEHDFTDSYIENYQCIVSLKDSAIKPADPSECEGLRVGYQEETTSDIYITNYQSENNVTIQTFEYAQVINAFTELEFGRVDAVICDSTVAASYVSDPESIYEITWQQEGDPEVFGICLKKGNTELQQKLNEALAALKENGKLDEILKKYFS